MKIGILSDCFGLDVEAGLQKAASLGADGVQLYAVEGELAPENMDAAKRAHLKTFIRDTGLEISAICGDLGEGGFAFADKNPAKIRRTKEIVDLTLDLGARIITTHIGVVPEDPHHPRFQVIREALEELGAYAHARGAVFAIETGPESGKTLLNMIEAVASPGIGVNLDPANLVMDDVDTAVNAVRVLGKHIVHTHAKDGKFLAPCDMDIMYGMVPVPDNFDENLYSAEVPLGEGDVGFDGYIAALREVGYDGYLTIEREVGDDPARDIALAVRFLKKYI